MKITHFLHTSVVFNAPYVLVACMKLKVCGKGFVYWCKKSFETS